MLYSLTIISNSLVIFDPSELSIKRNNTEKLSVVRTNLFQASFRTLFTQVYYKIALKLKC